MQYLSDMLPSSGPCQDSSSFGHTAVYLGWILKHLQANHCSNQCVEDKSIDQFFGHRKRQHGANSCNISEMKKNDVLKVF